MKELKEGRNKQKDKTNNATTKIKIRKGQAQEAGEKALEKLRKIKKGE